jgi:hypothetical protein
MSRIDSRHWKISTCRQFQNGRHNTAKIQHCPISSKFDMWVDNDVPNWFPTLKNFYRWPFSKWPAQYTAQIQHCPISTPFHMWVDYDVSNWFRHRTISTGRHFQNGRHHTAQIQHCSISTSWIDSRHRKISTGLHFQNSTLFDFKGSFWFIF